MPWELEPIGESGRPCEQILMRLRFPDIGLLPHPVGLVDFKDRHQEPPYKEKSECSKRKESNLKVETSRILNRFFSGFLRVPVEVFFIL
jgi:hypothetical protein